MRSVALLSSTLWTGFDKMCVRACAIDDIVVALPCSCVSSLEELLSCMANLARLYSLRSSTRRRWPGLFEE